jgi:hypothetical protein
MSPAAAQFQDRWTEGIGLVGRRAGTTVFGGSVVFVSIRNVPVNFLLPMVVTCRTGGANDC